ncbi:ACT domain-containing protein [Ensifer adhaerens]|nr:ACT domain-containing protein [Ensifer adhaerens]
MSHTMRYTVESDDLENILSRLLDVMRRLGVSVSKLAVEVDGGQARLDIDVSSASHAVSNTLRERIAQIAGTQPAQDLEHGGCAAVS